MTTAEMMEAVREHGGRVFQGTADIDLLSQGLLVRVSVHGSGIFNRSLRFEDLGISANDAELTEYIRPGQKSYAPRYSDQLTSWDVQCRQAVQKYCIKLDSINALTASRSWRFLYYDAYDDFKQRWDELQGVKDSIVNNIERVYDDLVDDAVTFYVRYAEESWRLLQLRYDYEGGAALHIRKLGLTFGPGDRDAYLDWVTDHIQADFPTMQSIRGSVYAEYLVNFMFDSASVAEANAREAEANAALQRSAMTALTDKLEREALERAANTKAWEERTTREAREQAIRQVELERMRARVRETADPYAEAMDQLLKELAGHIKALLAGFEKHGAFRGRSLDRIENMSETFRLLGGRHLGDQQLEQLLHDLKARRDSEPTPGNREAWTEQIAGGLEELRGQIRSHTQVIERRRSAQTRAGALEL